MIPSERCIADVLQNYHRSPIMRQIRSIGRRSIPCPMSQSAGDRWAADRPALTHGIISIRGIWKTMLIYRGKFDWSHHLNQFMQRHILYCLSIFLICPIGWCFSLESPEPSSAPSPAGEPVPSTFYYMPGKKYWFSLQMIELCGSNFAQFFFLNADCSCSHKTFSFFRTLSYFNYFLKLCILWLFYCSNQIINCVFSGSVDDCPCYAGLDEQLFYNDKYELMHSDDMAYSTYTGSYSWFLFIFI